MCYRVMRQHAPQSVQLYAAQAQYSPHLGRITRLSARCSITCAAQPVNTAHHEDWCE